MCFKSKDFDILNNELLKEFDQLSLLNKQITHYFLKNRKIDNDFSIFVNSFLFNKIQIKEPKIDLTDFIENLILLFESTTKFLFTDNEQKKFKTKWDNMENLCRANRKIKQLKTGSRIKNIFYEHKFKHNINTFEKTPNELLQTKSSNKKLAFPKS